jgi:hypothetical protein
MIIAAWNNLPMTIENSEVDSMPRRIQKFFDKEGERIS